MTLNPLTPSAPRPRALVLLVEGSPLHSLVRAQPLMGHGAGEGGGSDCPPTMPASQDTLSRWETALPRVWGVQG